MCSIWLLLLFFFVFHSRLNLSEVLFLFDSVLLWRGNHLVKGGRGVTQVLLLLLCFSHSFFCLFIYLSFLLFFEGEECFFTFCFFFFPFSLVARNTVAWFSRIAQPVFVLIERRCSWPLPFPISISFSSFFFFFLATSVLIFLTLLLTFFFPLLWKCVCFSCFFIVPFLFFFFNSELLRWPFFFSHLALLFFFYCWKGAYQKRYQKRSFFFVEFRAH